MKKIIYMFLLFVNISYANAFNIGNVAMVHIENELGKLIIVETLDKKLTLNDFKDAQYCYDAIRVSLQDYESVFTLLGKEAGATLAMYIVKTRPNTKAAVSKPFEFPEEIKKYLDSLPKERNGYDISLDRDILILDER